MASENKKCAHPACNCIAREGEKYCSPYCDSAKDKTEISCNCGHAGCAVSAGATSRPVY